MKRFTFVLFYRMSLDGKHPENARKTRQNAWRERAVSCYSVATGLWPVPADAPNLMKPAHRAVATLSLFLTQELSCFR
jgi:hypothetical protein